MRVRPSCLRLTLVIWVPSLVLSCTGDDPPDDGQNPVANGTTSASATVTSAPPASTLAGATSSAQTIPGPPSDPSTGLPTPTTSMVPPAQSSSTPTLMPTDEPSGEPSDTPADPSTDEMTDEVTDEMTDMGTGGMNGTDDGMDGSDTPTGAPEGGYPENTGAGCDVAAGDLGENEMLPDPFAMNDGTRITTKAEWTCRRNEIKKDIEKYEIGTKPEPPMVMATLDGDSLSVEVTTEAGSITLSSNVGGSGDCVAIGMGQAAGLISGCRSLVFAHDQVVAYGSNDNRNQDDPFYQVYPELWDQVSNYNAWSWGVSRLIDGLDQVKDELGIDMTKIGVQGCSYAGKMALFSGAFDERVALTIAQESGGGGVNAWRTSQNFTTRTGTNIEKIDNTNYSWFLPSMRMLDPYSLPHDHHELIAMVAPRAIVVLGNQDFEWLGDESGYKSSKAAKEVFTALGIADHIGLDFTSNHGHCQAPQSQTSTAGAFVDKFLKGQDADTDIDIPPEEGNFELDISDVVDWETPTLQ